MVEKAAEGADSTASTAARKRDQTPPPRPKVAEPADAGEASNGEKSAKEGRKDAEVETKEFGGPIGAVLIMVGSHIFLFFMASTLYGSDPAVFLPTPKSVTWFLAYHASQYLLGRTMPGVWVNGLSEKGYWCNAYCSFWLTIAAALLFHVGGIFDLTNLVKEYPAFLTTAVILGDIYSVVLHCIFGRGKQRLSAYDFFMGVETHPRMGIVDVKMIAEVRLSWVLLLLVTLGSFVQAARDLGTWMNPVAFMVLAHGLYGNAASKGEHFIPYTWDINVEKFGWMLCWWNLAGVPLFYCYQSLYLAKYSWAGLLLPPGPPALYYGVLAVALLVAYWIFDEANYQKCYFKMEQRGELIKRSLFPTFWHLKDPKYIKCDAGVLLTDGWYGRARKIHYTADTAMALLWGLSCGFGSLLPYSYFLFFVAMITHRNWRDEVRCRKKYGATWDKYLKAVPYAFIPGVY